MIEVQIQQLWMHCIFLLVVDPQNVTYFQNVATLKNDFHDVV